MNRNKFEKAKIDIIFQAYLEISHNSLKSPMNCPCVVDGLGELVETSEILKRSNNLIQQLSWVCCDEINGIEKPGPKLTTNP